MELEQEKALIEKSKKDLQAFGLLYDEYYDKIYYYSLLRTARIDVSQDVTSEVFLKALKNIKRFKWRGIPFYHWLLRIANHEIANHYRENGQGIMILEKVSQNIKLQHKPPESELENAEAEVRKCEAFLDIHKKLPMLPIKYQEVIVLRFFKNKKLNEIKEILGKNEGTVKTLLYRGLAKLKTLMEQDTP
ncbi:MAG: sigma-70 family RNA polymerase sigma factor [Dehalococcoidia bacterium]|nr:MAG: sigma-70 family RNA polymerase sigma factor [Dehalococcoidia bacterium]